MAAPTSTEDSASRAAAELKWRLLRLFNLFRGVAAGLLVLLFLVDDPPRLLGSTGPGMFLGTAVVYLVLTLVFAFTLVRRRAGVARQAFAQLGADLICVPLLLHASGGLGSGLAALLIVSVIAASFVLSERFALLTAAVATILLLYEQSVARLEGLASERAWAQVAALGAIFLTTALIGTRLARRAYESEDLAQRRGADLVELTRLNDQIVEHLQTGVVVVDEHDAITQLNASAAAFLGLPASARGQRLASAAPLLASVVAAWREQPARDPPSFPAAGDGRPIMPRVQAFGSAERAGLLVFLEDPRLAADRVQDVKLAALGRLTASIAHEVRNPLAALSHANQLLAESERLGDEERRFSGIISAHVARVDAIVDSVLALGRPGGGRPDELDLAQAVADVCDEFARANAGCAVEFARPAHAVPARIDPTHLHQVLTNLLANAARHGVDGEGMARIAIRCQRLPEGDAIVEVEDRGPGVPDQVALHIFEPFYSGSARGTGLGLFIARELCAANRATLAYQRAPGGGACFRITLPNPSRWVV